MTRLHVHNPADNFCCEGCGNVFNEALLDTEGGREYCPKCTQSVRGQTEPVPNVTLFRKMKERKFQAAQVAVNVAESDLQEACNAEAAYFNKKVQLPEVGPAVIPVAATEGEPEELAAPSGEESEERSATDEELNAAPEAD